MRTRLVDLQDFECIPLRFLTDMKAHDLGCHVGCTAASGAGPASAVQIEEAVRANLQLRKTLAECLIVEPADTNIVACHQAGLSQGEGPGAQADQRDFSRRRPLEEPDGFVVDRVFAVEQAADDDDVVEWGRVDQARCWRHLHSAA
ncbi:hypothetical protein D9M70_503310 [compost metagenome]